jgi:hypothetical protein
MESERAKRSDKISQDLHIGIISCKLIYIEQICDLQNYLLSGLLYCKFGENNFLDGNIFYKFPPGGF